MSLNNPDFETHLQSEMDNKLTQVAYKAITCTLSAQYPNARIVRKTFVVSVIEKSGHVGDLSTEGAN